MLAYPGHTVEGMWQPDQAGASGGAAEIDVAALLEALRRSKQEMEIAQRQFDTVTEPLLIDHVVFRLGAAERQFNYLFQLARRLNISVEGVWSGWSDTH
ncbi:hypothetical protein GCM10010885_22930 [Alicyclobacillus cellulosilyticus]|uniref:DUF2508 family protein n=1 Tax=Alicyclobacillus cellulosilyticus TaxID=1003997 RepID=A0A917NN00_9BACL|nr:YaaL family protein [Alicyclobacillus cellulosilyticus]GGJ13063.1 hypothetical protein GCM10010885_22930 [Alicyclobacillus cellulosilyticus]